MSIEPVTSDPSGGSDNEQENQIGDLNGREVKIQEHKDRANEHFRDFFISPIEAAANVIVNLSPTGVMNAVKVISENHHHLIDGCAERNEAHRLENEAKGLDMFYNPIETEKAYESNECDHENDRDNWDRDF